MYDSSSCCVMALQRSWAGLRPAELKSSSRLPRRWHPSPGGSSAQVGCPRIVTPFVTHAPVAKWQDWWPKELLQLCITLPQINLVILLQVAIDVIFTSSHRAALSCISNTDGMKLWAESACILGDATFFISQEEEA